MATPSTATYFSLDPKAHSGRRIQQAFLTLPPNPLPASSETNQEKANPTKEHKEIANIDLKHCDCLIASNAKLL